MSRTKINQYKMSRPVREDILKALRRVHSAGFVSYDRVRASKPPYKDGEQKEMYARALARVQRSLCHEPVLFSQAMNARITSVLERIHEFGWRNSEIAWRGPGVYRGDGMHTFNEAIDQIERIVARKERA